MGVRYGREYSDIVRDLMEAINLIDGFYGAFEMSDEDWNSLDAYEQKECLRTLSDDVFYGLGNEPVLNIGQGMLKYDKDNHVIKLFNGEKCVYIVTLV
ncbi:MAG: Imm40 domain-containing protein [Xylanivirga thermophila]|jgi:hypothetical protein|uniref:hypothetical protein n=1 Tax=Xylanivirga thermophila TaxID=2496273 RepID=UPI00101CEFE5|nr:hypothetical protein [Xylanivirga thermophila]